MSRLARVLIYDLESAPAMGLFFGKPYDVNIAKIVQPEYIFGFAYKWLDEKKIHSSYIWDYPLYKKDKTNSIEVIKHWAGLVEQADILVGHNSDSFDYKHMFGRLVLYDLPPVPRPKFVDTKKAAKQIGNYQSNKLDDLGGYLGTGRKLAHTGYPNAIDLWWDCMNNVEKAKKHMVKYNKVDVQRTEELYLMFRPYMTSHPNLAVLNDRMEACPKCGVEGQMIGQGIVHDAVPKQRWKCKACRAYSRSRIGEKGNRSLYV